jgi:hypothetical protein
MTRWTLCIDFGTAFSKAAAAPADAWADFDPGAVRPLALAGHEAGGNPFLLDSAVFIGEHSVLFGRAAIAEAAGAGRKRMALRSFKTLLSVSDLDRALNTNAPASIDPHRVFQMRDLVVLYLAYLLAAIDRAIAGDATLSCAPEILYRYAAPAWRRGDSAGGHGSITDFRSGVKTAASPLTNFCINAALPAHERNSFIEAGISAERTRTILSAVGR